MADLIAATALLDEAVADNRLDDALRQLQAMPDALRDTAQVMAREAALLGRVGDHDREIDIYRKLIERRPDDADLLVVLAGALRMVGRRDEAVTTLRQAIAIDPAHVRAWGALSDLKHAAFDEGDLTAMTALLGRQTHDADRIPLHFALGKAYEDHGQPDLAFDHYQSANALRAASFGRTSIGIVRKVDQMIESMTADFFAARSGWGHDSDAPIFVIGVQRSGSTLVEQILASHPHIEGTGELPIMAKILGSIMGGDQPGVALSERLAMLDRDQVRHLGQRYLDLAAHHRHSDRPRFVDKHPGNWSNIGLIRLILPNARIIDARRHPLASGWSNFKQDYGRSSFFSYDLATIGAYYRQYLRLVGHFERIGPRALHRVVNETLIEDFEPQVRDLLAHVGVPFDPACLAFHTNARAVRTPSAEQVRRPINRDGVDRWRSVESRLDPLKAALGPALAGWNAAPGTYRDEDD